VQDKRATLAEAAGLVRDGDVVALQNMATQAAPMTLVRELIRQERRGLSLVVLVGGIGVDWLAASGVIDRLIGAAVTMEQFGLCQRYRAAVEAGRIRVEELSESLLNARLGAGARQLPFLPSRGAIGTDLIGRNPENLRLIEDPFGGRPLLACRALVPDVALVHAHRADRHGNVQYDPTAMWPDLAVMPYAARRVIVSVEEIVDSELLRRHPERTVLPGFIVDAVVEAPCGAHPTSFFPAYGYDAELHRAWARVARDEADAQHFLDHHVRAPANQAEYLLAAGGEAMLARIRAGAA
jgi:glutaconate CoA-transferase subunit A